jgi:hypothetical protein
MDNVMCISDDVLPLLIDITSNIMPESYDIKCDIVIQGGIEVIPKKFNNSNQ